MFCSIRGEAANQASMRARGCAPLVLFGFVNPDDERRGPPVAMPRLEITPARNC